MTAPRDILILGYGNPARGDDGLGPAFAHVMQNAGLPGVEVLWDYQPSVEHAAEIAGHRAVIFADASAVTRDPFAFRRLHPRPSRSFTSHVLPPEAVLSLACTALGWAGDAYLLALRGYAFRAFDESLTASARRNLDDAVAHITDGITRGGLAQPATDPPTNRSDAGGPPWTDTNA